MSMLAAVAITFYVASSIVLVRLHAREPHVDMVGHAVSDYGISESGWLFKLHGLLGCAAAVVIAALLATSQQPRFPVRTVALAVFLACGRLGVAFVPTDAHGSDRTPAGRLHFAFAALTFASATLLIISATPVLSGALADSFVALAWTVLMWGVIIAAAGMLATRFAVLRNAFGLFERTFIASSTLWFITLAGWFWTRL